MTAATRPAFHDGELALQAAAGTLDEVAVLGARMLRPQLTDQLRSFFQQLPFVVLGTVDAAGQPVAQLLGGAPGFVASPDAGLLRIASSASPGLEAGEAIGLLGIEPHTRRRNRANGTVEHVDAQGFDVRIAQSYGNCPRHIVQRRAVFDAAVPPAAEGVGTMATLDAAALALIGAADTLFIATAHPAAAAGGRDLPAEQGVDVSHRGGPAGFVRASVDASGQQWLTLPDYDGNRFFNTWGNLALHPRAGLLVIDFTTSTQLQVRVDTELLWPEEEGGVRVLRMRVRGARRVAGPAGLHWQAQAA